MSMDINMYIIAKLYALFYIFVKRVTGWNMPGLGFILRHVGKDLVFVIGGQKMFFNHKVASSYGLLIADVWQEPETHSLIGLVLKKLSGSIAFVDVGANIGEMMVDAARYQNVHCYGFEPSAECIHAISESMQLNCRKNFTLFQNLIGDISQMVPFSEGRDVNSASVHSDISKAGCKLTKQLTLDESLILNEDHALFLIDVEGYEPQVLRGGANLIKQKRPLVIFEYNFVSKRYFTIGDIRGILGKDYEIFRLRKDAMLDKDVEHAWNCVAVPRGSEFESVVQSRIIRVEN